MLLNNSSGFGIFKQKQPFVGVLEREVVLKVLQNLRQKNSLVETFSVKVMTVHIKGFNCAC